MAEVFQFVQRLVEGPRIRELLRAATTDASSGGLGLGFAS